MAKSDGWGSEWTSGAGWLDKPKQENEAKLKFPDDWLTHTSDVANSPQSGIEGLAPWPSDEDIVIEKVLNEGWPKAPELTKAIGDLVEANFDTSKFKSQGSNLVDDQAYLYFQCESCNEILDPHTKSFAKLQEARAKAGWKCVWNMNGQGYKVYCAKCGEKI